MRLQPFLCLGGTEIANIARSLAYGSCGFFDGGCPCPALETETYTDPATDDAPWYDADHPESADFLGFLPRSITLSTVASRPTAVLGTTGSFIGREHLQGRVVAVEGWMIANTLEGMWWGERWLTEALRGDLCEGCSGDVLTVLPFCRDEPISADFDGDFRQLVATSLVDGPRFAELSDDPSFFVFTAQFQFVSSMPWLYEPATRCLDEEPLIGTLNCALTTPDLVEDGTFVIDVTNVGTTDVTDLVITGKLSLDGSCPVTGDGTSVPDSFRYEIATLAPEDRIVIDGMRRQARYYDASDKRPSSALPYITWSGPFVWPDAGPCSTVCVAIESSGGDATVTVDALLRSL